MRAQHFLGLHRVADDEAEDAKFHRVGQGDGAHVDAVVGKRLRHH